MSKVIQIATGYSNVTLPDGKTYGSGMLITLTDAQWTAMSPFQLQRVVLLYSRPETPTVDPVVQPDSYTTQLVSESIEKLHLIDGPPGPPGPQGPVGPVGPEPAPSVYSGTWSSFSTAHSFSYLPPVRLIDSTGEEVEIAIEYPDSSHISIVFPVPFTGTIIVG